MKNRLKILLSLDRYIWILFACYFGFTLVFLLFLAVSTSHGDTSTGVIPSLYTMIIPIYLFCKSFTRYNNELNIWTGFGLTRKQFLSTNLVYYLILCGVLAVLAPILVTIETQIGYMVFSHYSPQAHTPLFIYHQEQLDYLATSATIFFAYMLGLIICHAVASLLYYLKTRPIIRGAIIMLGVYVLIFNIAYLNNLFAIIFIPIYILIAMVVNYITLMKADIPS